MKNTWVSFWTSGFSKANLTLYAVFCGQNAGGVSRPKWRRRFVAKMPAVFRRQTRQWRPLASWSPPICAGQGRVGRRGLIPAPILRRFKVGRPTVPCSGRKRRHLRWLAVKRRKNGADLHLGSSYNILIFFKPSVTSVLHAFVHEYSYHIKINFGKGEERKLRK